MHDHGIGNVFRSRNFRLVFLGALVSELGALLYSFAVSFYILEISGNSAFLQGLYLALCGAATLILTPVGGVLGDRFSKSKIMYVCDFLKGGLILLAAFLLTVFRAEQTQLVVLFALGILGSAVSGIFTPAADSLFPHIVREEQLQQANAYFSIKSSLESILGVILAGFLYAALPIHTLFFLVGICFVASGVSEMLIRYDHRPSPEKLTLGLAVRDMREGLRYLKARKAVLTLLGVILFINFFFAPVTGNFLPYFVRTDLTSAPAYLMDHALTPELWSSVFSACFGVSSLVGAAILSARKTKEKFGFETGLKLCSVAALMVALALGYWLLVDRGASLNGFLILFSLGCLMMGFLISWINIPVSTAMMRIVDRDKLSKVSSILGIGSQGMIPIASVLAGLVLQALGSAALLFICAAGFTVTALLCLSSRPLREL